MAWSSSIALKTPRSREVALDGWDDDGRDRPNTTWSESFSTSGAEVSMLCLSDSEGPEGPPPED